jgi:hypothetical protein
MRGGRSISPWISQVIAENLQQSPVSGLGDHHSPQFRLLVVRGVNRFNSIPSRLQQLVAPRATEKEGNAERKQYTNGFHHCDSGTRVPLHAVLIKLSLDPNFRLSTHQKNGVGCTLLQMSQD